ncbi:MAG TPA: hypothetical protein VLX68_11515 [Chitinivibrionales bacterium]|nr:hypothetical protein [Chitinivibrionales bacterium]
MSMRILRYIFFVTLAAVALLMFCAAPSTAPGPSIPPTPLSVSATGISMSAISVSWVSIINATSYRVFKSANDNGMFVAVDTVTKNIYNDTGLVPGSIYYYKVSALNNLGESGQSAAVLGTTAIPGMVAAKCTLATRIMVTWTPVVGAASYTVYRDTVDTGAFLFSETATTDTLVDSGLANGTRYFYKIKAVNNNGISGVSFIKNTITVPATPVDTQASGQTSSKIIIKWSGVTGASSYNIYRSAVDTGVFTVIASVTADSFSDTNLFSGTYCYQLSALNSSGESSLSSVFCSFTIPGMPSNISAAGISSSSIKLTWPSVPAASSYNVYRDSFSTAASVAADTAAANQFIDSGLAAGSTHTYQISAVNRFGESVRSPSISAITICQPPSGVSAAAVSKSAIMTTWSTVAGAASFNIYRDTVDTGAYSLVGNASTDTFTDTGLVAGVTYYYKISALNASGESGQSAPASATTMVTGFAPLLHPLEMLAIKFLFQEESSERNRHG